MPDHPAAGKPWAIKQNWSDLLFMHWPVDEAQLRALVPPALEIDTFDGIAWIAVVPFLMTGIRLRRMPPVPGTTRTLEMNVRTYVKHGSRRGVYFFSLDAENGLIVRTARAWFGLPYYKADMSLRKATYTRYESRRIHPNAPPCVFRAVYRPIGDVTPAVSGSLEHFLTERYCLFVAPKDKPVSIGEIHHKPWPLRRAEAEIEANDMTVPLGIEVDGRPLLHYSASLNVWLQAMQPHRPV